jgi:hypothetical protein
MMQRPIDSDYQLHVDRFGPLNVSDEVKRNPEILKVALSLRQNGLALEFVPEELKNNRELVLVAVVSNALSLQYASDMLKNDQEVLVAAAKQNILGLNFMPEELRHNRELMLALVTHVGEALSQTPNEDIKNDREIVLAAVKNNGFALQYASDAMKNDREIVLTALTALRGRGCYDFVSNELKNDREVILAALRQDCSVLTRIPITMQNDREVLLAAVEHSGFALRYMPEVWRDDYDMVLAAMRKGGSLGDASKELQNNREIVLAAVQRYGQSIHFASEALKNDREVAMVAVLSTRENVLRYLPEVLRNDFDIVKCAVRKGRYSLESASDKLKRNVDIVFAAICGGGLSMRRHAHPDFQSGLFLEQCALEGVMSSKAFQKVFLVGFLTRPRRPTASEEADMACEDNSTSTTSSSSSSQPHRDHRPCKLTILNKLGKYRTDYVKKHIAGYANIYFFGDDRLWCLKRALRRLRPDLMNVWGGL